MVEKEIKYLVIKREDIKVALSSSEHLDLNILLKKIERYRFDRGKSQNHYIVCNQDEPYAELICQTILQGERIKFAERGS